MISAFATKNGVVLGLRRTAEKSNEITAVPELLELLELEGAMRLNSVITTNLDILSMPEIAKEDCFAMHGGTAINLFLQDMPRLSVDIDLTYVGLEVRAESFVAK